MSLGGIYRIATSKETVWHILMTNWGLLGKGDGNDHLEGTRTQSIPIHDKAPRGAPCSLQNRKVKGPFQRRG